MIVYCDTSFLVSLLYEGDANHKAARETAGRFDGQDFVLCQTHQLELPASIRAATHRAESPIPVHVARTIINRFDRAWNGRAFARRDLSFDDSVAMARSLGETHGWAARHTSFDLWHLAAAWTLGASAFLTFDKRQKEICPTLSLRTG
jgi:predicted nucleic acid-binding protein